MLLTAGTEGQGHQAELFPCDMEEQGELTKERVGSGASSRTVSGSESSYSEPEAVAPLGAEARLLPPPSEHQIREVRRARARRPAGKCCCATWDSIIHHGGHQPHRLPNPGTWA